MSKTTALRKKSTATVVISVFLIAFVIISYTSWPIETPLSRYIAPKDEYYIKIEMMLNEVVSDVANVRMLEKPGSFKFRVVTVDWVKENWGRRSAEAAIEEVKIEEEIYKAIFLIPENFSLVESKVQQAGYIMAALAGDTLYFVREYFDPYNEEVAKETVAHEVAHLLQSINFNVEESAEFDTRHAKNALIEGDAEVTKAKYLIYKFNKSVEKSTLPSGNGTITERDALWLLWVAPGMYGIEFVETLYEEGGWDKVNEAFNILPASMEQIMHPEKYLAREGVVDVEPESIEDWELIRSDRFGEHFIMLVLARHIPADQAKLAAEGWAGDRFSYYKKNGDYLFLWKTFWDSLTDRDEYLSALRGLLSSIQGGEIAPYYWRTYHGYLKVKVDDLSVTIIAASKPYALTLFDQ